MSTSQELYEWIGRDRATAYWNEWCENRRIDPRGTHSVNLIRTFDEALKEKYPQTENQPTSTTDNVPDLPGGFDRRTTSSPTSPHTTEQPMATASEITAALKKEGRRIDMSKVIKDPGSISKREDFDAWWRATKRWITVQDGLSDLQKILGVLSRMTGPLADNWAAKEEDKYQKLVEDHKDDEIIWATFAHDIEAHWVITHKADTVKACIYAFKQEKKPVDEFLDEFEHLLELSMLGEETGKFLLEQNTMRRITEVVSSFDLGYKDYLKEVRKKEQQ